MENHSLILVLVREATMAAFRRWPAVSWQQHLSELIVKSWWPDEFTGPLVHSSSS